MSARLEMTLKSNSWESLSFFYRNKFDLNPTIKTEIFQFKYIDDVILRQPEVRLSTTTVETLEWFGQELWMDKPTAKKECTLHVLHVIA